MRQAGSHKITICFDATQMAAPNPTGVGRTSKGLIAALARMYPDELELVGHYFGRCDVVGDSLPKAANIRYRPTTLMPARVCNMLRRLGVWLPFELLVKQRGDFHLFPGFIGWPSLFRTPSAPFVHDVTFIDYPQYVSGPARFDLRTLLPRTLKRAAFVITNSETSKAGLQRVYDLQATPVLVEHIPLVDAVELAPGEAAERVARLDIHGKYILFLGTLEPRKNLAGLLAAYAMLGEDLQKGYSLVVTGGKGWNDIELLAKLNSLRESGANVIQTGYVSDEDRAALYIQAAIYVMPSHYEGFGMQLIEAMHYHAPILASDIPILREVAGEAASYCATDAASIAKSLTRLLGDDVGRSKQIAAGTRRLANFNWDSVAADVYGAIRKATDAKTHRN